MSNVNKCIHNGSPCFVERSSSYLKKKREKKDLCKGKKENEDCGEQLKEEGMEKHLFARLC